MRRYFLLLFCLVGVLFSADLTFVQAKKYLQTGRYTEAYRVFAYVGANRSYLRHYCDYYRAVASHGAGKYARAAEILERYLTQSEIPYKEEALELLNECYIKLDRPKEIHPLAVYSKVQKHFWASEYPEALRLLKIVSANNMLAVLPEDTYYYLARAYMYCAEPEQTRQILSGRSGAGALYYLAMLDLHQRKTAAANTKLDQLVRRYPDSSYAPLALFSLARRGGGAARLAYYRQLYQKYPSSRYADYAAWEVGWEFYKKKQYQAAAKIFQEGYQLNKYSDNADSLLYWLARAYQELGRAKDAQLAFGQTVQEFPARYYGWRAAQRLDIKPILPVGKIQLRDVRPKTDKALLEFVETAEYADALEEAKWIADRSKQERVLNALRIYMAAAAAKNGNHQEAIRISTPVLRAAEQDNDYSMVPRELWRISFPRAYVSHVEHSSRRNALDVNYVYALIREESHYDEQALSHANAYGLMQVIPSTAAGVFKKMGINEEPLPAVLFQPNINIMLGASYLRQMLDQFQQNEHLALAAYNAGPTATGRWLRQQGGKLTDLDMFVENISYTETRNYVKRVMRGYWLYSIIYTEV